MATPNREQIAKQLLHHASKPTSGKPKRVSHASARPPRRHKIPHRLPSPTEEQLERREQGWNDRFARDSPSEPKRPIRAHRAIDEGAESHNQKERKIREERQQYGYADVPKQQRPGVGRLVPIAPLSLPPREPEKHSSSEEKLRFKVLKAIDIRETLIYQLNALILCTPVQEAIVMAAPRPSSGSHPKIKPRATMAIAASLISPAHANNSAMSDAREAMRLAQQLGADLQISGIHVVEGIVEWMLEAGAKADKPPEFSWRGRNYFLKMIDDLDFAGAELRVRGVQLDCFTEGNPLCIRPDQKLGRVLAAQSIIKEMVDLARQGTSTQGKASITITDRQTRNGRKAKSISTGQHSNVMGQAEETIQSGANEQYHASADEMIAADNTADYNEHADAITSARYVDVPVATSQSSVTSLSVLRDHETDSELVNILDESFCEATAWKDDHTGGSSVHPSARSVKSSSRDEYENSFDAEVEGDAPQRREQDDEADTGFSDAPPSPRGPVDHPQDEDTSLPREDATLTDHQQYHDTLSSNESATPPRIEETDSAKRELECGDGELSTDTQWDRAAAVLRTSVSGIDGLSGLALQKWVEWTTLQHHELQIAVKKASWSDVHSTLNGSLLRGFSGVWSTAEMFQSLVASLKSSSVLKDIMLASSFIRQCQIVLDEVCNGLASALQHDVQLISPLVSEVDFTDVIDAAEKLFDEGEIVSVLLWVRRTVELISALHPTHPLESVPYGLTKLLQVFYPYLVNQRRDKLVQSWNQTSKLFVDKCGIHVEQLCFLLDTSCKILLLNVSCLRRISEEQAEDTAASVPKLSLVCNRASLVESSYKVVVKKCFKGQDEKKLLPSYQLYPFFQSTFGEKIVDGERVEEGEGKGPLKEWFTLIAKDLTSKWSKVELSADASDDFDPVLVNGNKLVVDRLDHCLKSGYKVEWLSPVDGTMISRTINSCDASNGTYMLDRGGIANQSYNVSALQVFQPRTAFLEYIQASESYWLNEAVADTPTNRQLLEFVGWFLANALVHQCTLQLRLHQLLFTLLQDSKRQVTLEDLKSLDPTLYTAMEQLQCMKPAEFASYVEFEGYSSLLSLDEYMTITIDEKYGSKSNIAWQIQELRHGFRRVFNPDDLHRCSISAAELSEHLCGENQANKAKDFDVAEIFRVSLDPDFASCAPLQRSFWKAVNGFDPPLKRQMVKFVTGVDTLPQIGTEFIRIEMPFPARSPIECERTLRMLPQSHTCDNTLELPHYWRALCWKHNHDVDRPNETLENELVTLLAEKLRMATEYSSGYGLDGTTSEGMTLAGILPGSHTETDQLDIQDSYESLNLPGLGGDSVEESKTEAAPQEDELGSLETPHVGSSKPDDSKDKAPEEEEYGAEDWDVEDVDE